MSDALSLAEMDRQHVELLPARTVLSLFATSVSTDPPCDAHQNCSYPPGHQYNSGPGNYGNTTYGNDSHQTNVSGGGANRRHG